MSYSNSLPNTHPNRKLSTEQTINILQILKHRFETNIHRHADLEWKEIEMKLEVNPDKIWSLYQMEKSGGEPDVIDFRQNTREYIFYDCCPESPLGRRNLCFDREARDSRKKFKPESSAEDMALWMGVELLTEEEYHTLQKSGPFDTKTSSWLATPAAIRALGGAIFGHFRYGQVFIFHNGAESYYAVRGFRGKIMV